MLPYRKVETGFFKPNPAPRRLSEVYSQNEFMPEFALVSPSGNQIGSWMRCKDYIQDSIWGSRTGQSYCIHGWSFDHTTDKVSKRHILLAMRLVGTTHDKLVDYLLNIKRTVESFEKRLGIPKFRRTRFSRIRRGNAEHPHFIVYGSPDWARASHTISFFTWMLRSSFLNESGTIEGLASTQFLVKRDAYYARSGVKFISHILENGLDSIPRNMENESLGVGHIHNAGWVSYTSYNLGGKSLSLSGPTNIPKEEWKF